MALRGGEYPAQRGRARGPRRHTNWSKRAWFVLSSRYRTVGVALLQFETTGHLQVRACSARGDFREQIASSKAAARAIGDFDLLT